MGFLTDIFYNPNRNRTNKADVAEEEANNPITVNLLSEEGYRQWCFSGKIGGKNYSELFLWTILSYVFGGVKNGSFITSKDQLQPKAIASFLENNAVQMVYNYIQDGYITVKYDRDNNFKVMNGDTLHKKDGYVVEKNTVTVYSDTYVTERRSLYNLIAPHLKLIDKYLNSSEYLTSTFGALGILSGKGMPQQPEQKAKFEEQLKNKYGAGADQWQFIISNQELDFQQVKLPIDELKLDEKVKDSIKYICNLFKISPDLIFGNSTYNNVGEAKIWFYRNTIIPFLDEILRLGRALLLQVTSGIPTKYLTYRITNVPELNTTVSSQCEELTSQLDLLLKLKSALPEKQEEITKEIEKILTETERLSYDI